MATADVVDTGPKGYPKEIFEAVDSKYLCGRCDLILKSPLQSYCGHRFCRDCFDFLLEASVGNEVTCPLCTLEDSVAEYSILSKEQTFPDNALKREFIKLKAHCRYPGCTWSGLFKDFETHFDSCEFRSTNQKEINGSVTEAFVDLNKRVTSAERHVADLKQRVERVGLVVEGGVGISSAAETSAPAASSGSAEASAAAVQLSELQPVQRKMEIFEGIVAVIGRELEKYSEQTQGIERQDRLSNNLLETVKKKSDEVDGLMRSKDVAIENVERRISVLDQTSYDGTLLWKISDFQTRRMEAINGQATSFYSPPFYTSRTGYKMCARIYLNGDGIGKGTHISLFFVVMRGAYDSLLKWPFRQKVTLMFLDQNNRTHVSDSFRPDPTSSSFKRPSAEMNVASGCPLFIQLSTLDSSSNAYVRDNTAYVKIIVSLEGLS